MPGRNAKPLQLIMSEGNKRHLTKKEINHREKHEQSLYTGTTFKESQQVKEDEIAHKEFLRLKKLYKHIEYVDGLDETVINRYCIMQSELHSLDKFIEQCHGDLVEAKQRLASKDIDFLAYLQVKGDIQNKILEADRAIMKKREMLIKLEDRLFLNPTSRIKSIPKAPKEDKAKSPMTAFLERKRAGGHET